MSNLRGYLLEFLLQHMAIDIEVYEVFEGGNDSTSDFPRVEMQVQVQVNVRVEKLNSLASLHFTQKLKKSVFYIYNCNSCKMIRKPLSFTKKFNFYKSRIRPKKHAGHPQI